MSIQVEGDESVNIGQWVRNIWERFGPSELKARTQLAEDIKNEGGRIEIHEGVYITFDLDSNMATAHLLLGIYCASYPYHVKPKMHD